MRVLEIEKLFKDEKNLDKVLAEVTSDFETVDYWSGVRKDNLTTNSEEIDRALNELSGAYSNLYVVLALAETEKKNREVVKKNTIRIEIENEGGKYTDTKASTQASAFIADYRRIRNIIQAYADSAEKHIVTLQSILKDIGKDTKHPAQ